MEKFKMSIKKRVITTEVFCAAAAVLIIAIAFYVSHKPVNAEAADIRDKIGGFQMGVFVGLQFVMIAYIVKYSRALKNEESLKKLYIEENDERRKFIADKMGGAYTRFSIGAVATAVIISGFYNLTVFFTLLCVLLFLLFTTIFLKIYYKNKF